MCSKGLSAFFCQFQFQTGAIIRLSENLHQYYTGGLTVPVKLIFIFSDFQSAVDL